MDAPGQPLVADLYRPARPRRALVLVHGLSSAGRRHPELMRLAGLLAAHGQLVMVPHFPSLAAFRLDGREVEQVRAALRHMAGTALPLGVGGFSFGAGPAVIAASAMPEVALAASFGGYADLRNVIVFVTTGAHGFQGVRDQRPRRSTTAGSSSPSSWGSSRTPGIGSASTRSRAAGSRIRARTPRPPRPPSATERGPC